jgi:hypothetical protein
MQCEISFQLKQFSETLHSNGFSPVCHYMLLQMLFGTKFNHTFWPVANKIWNSFVSGCVCHQLCLLNSFPQSGLSPFALGSGFSFVLPAQSSEKAAVTDVRLTLLVCPMKQFVVPRTAHMHEPHVTPQPLANISCPVVPSHVSPQLKFVFIVIVLHCLWSSVCCVLYDRGALFSMLCNFYVVFYCSTTAIK